MNTKVFMNLFLLVALTNLLPDVSAQQRPAGPPQGMDRNIGVLRGKLIDSYSSQAVEYGNIVLFRQQDSTMQNGTITGPDGKFIIEQIPLGRYYAVVQFIGFENKTIPGIAFNPRSPETDLGEIMINPSSTALEGVEITAERDLMLANLDKRVINVDKDLTGIGGTAVDIMQNIPSVTVDIEGNVQLRGSGNVLILIDGRPTGLQDLNSSDILQQIPANTIERVEVITNPSVRYDPEGTSGIINIVLKKRSLEGFNGMVQGNYGTFGRFNGGVNLNMRTEKFNFFGSYDTRMNTFSGTSKMHRNTTFNDVSTLLDQEGESEYNMTMHLGNLGFDYSPNRYNTFSAAVRYRNFAMINDGGLLNKTMLADGTPLREFNRDSDSRRFMKGFNYNFSYRLTTARQGEELTADLIINNNAMRRTEQIVQEDFFPFESETKQQSRSRNTNKQATLRANYIRPLNETSRLEGGFSSSIKFLTMRYNYDWWDAEADTLIWIEDSVLANYFLMDEQIHAIYGLYAGMSGKFRYQVGLRGEVSVTDGEQELSSETFRNSYITAYPSVHLVYNFAQNQDIQLSYSRRVSRPRHWFLNPYVDYSDSLNIRSGNPELTPEFTGSWDISYVISKNRNSLTTSVFYRKTTDMIQRVSRLHADGVTWNSWENITDGQFIGVELIGSYEFAKWLRITANASYFRQTINAYESGDRRFSIDKSQDYTWNSRLNAQFTVTKNSTLQLSGNYSAPTIMAQGRMEEMYFADIAWRTDFWDRKATFSLRLSDVFDSRKFSSETWGPDFNTVSERKRDSRVIWVGLSYRWNNFQRQRDRMRNGDDMDMEEF
jgi:outer membrane receptor protein involved in Fe transport